MLFKFEHLDFGTTVLRRDDEFPSWTKHKEMGFVHELAMKLAPGKFIETDFHRITRMF